MNPKTRAFFFSYNILDRMSRNGFWNAMVKYAKRLGLHHPESSRLEECFDPQSSGTGLPLLIRNGMPREYVEEPSGDKRGEAIDIYTT
ncbi:MAG: hypothetical protein QXQ53_04740 [Candidatus Methanosuratincola sp.]